MEKEVHCHNCDRFLGYHEMKAGTIRIYCSRCKSFTIIGIEQPKVDNIRGFTPRDDNMLLTGSS